MCFKWFRENNIPVLQQLYGPWICFSIGTFQSLSIVRNDLIFKVFCFVKQEH